MKNNVMKLVLPVFAALIISGCGIQSHVEKDPSVKLDSYRTYSWIGDKSSDAKNKKPYKDFQDTYLTRLISEHLEKNGFVKAKSNPDILIDYDVMVENDVRLQSDPMYSRSFVRYFYNPYTGRVNGRYFPSRYMGQADYEVPYKSGTITINIVDNDSRQLVWQGWAETEVTSRKISKDEMNRIVKSIFKKLDVARN